MLWVIHILFGIMFGLSFNSIFLVILTAFLSHFILDLAPHWDGIFDKKNFQKTGVAKIPIIDVIVRGIDFILGLIILYYFFNETGKHIILLGGFFAILPDFLKVFYYTPLIKSEFYKRYLGFHSRIQNDVNWLNGLIIQIIAGFIAFTIIVNLL